MIGYIRMLGCPSRFYRTQQGPPQSEFPNGQLGTGSCRGGPRGRPRWKFGSREGTAIRAAVRSDLGEQSENVYENKGSALKRLLENRGPCHPARSEESRQLSFQRTAEILRRLRLLRMTAGGVSLQPVDCRPEGRRYEETDGTKRECL